MINRPTNAHISITVVHIFVVVFDSVIFIVAQKFIAQYLFCFTGSVDSEFRLGLLAGCSFCLKSSCLLMFIVGLS